MAFITPDPVDPGDVLSASKYNQDVVENGLAGRPIFTNEAGRDAAITAPYEGQTAYLTTPTVPAATGATTAVPSGVTTIYNGSVWVCTTPVGAYSNTTATTASASYVNTLTSDGTAISVTLVTGTTAQINFTAIGAHASASGLVFVSFAVSGATTIAANDTNAQYINGPDGAYSATLARSFVFTGLTAGTNTFTMNYKSGGGTITFNNRNLTVQGVA
jgi:hypothetical protein